MEQRRVAGSGVLLLLLPFWYEFFACRICTQARLAQSAERKALNLLVAGSNPTVGAFNPCARTSAPAGSR